LDDNDIDILANIEIASLECWDEVDDEKYGELGSGNIVDGEGN
jgi:hypothetical protein